MSSGSGTNESIEETIERLSGSVGEASTGERSGEPGRATDSTRDENARKLVERAEGAVESLLAGDGMTRESHEDIEELRTVIAEASELLETVDLTEAFGAIDADDIDEAIDAGEVPAALLEGEADEAISYSKLLQLVEFGQLLDATDVREVQQNKDEFDAAVTEFVDDRNEEGGWVVLDALKWLVETAVEADSDVAEVGETEEGEQMKQVAMQSKLLDTVSEFREGVLEAHDQLKELREQADHVTSDIGQPSSQNPTAYSTLPPQGHPRFETKFSTVPRDTRHSTVSNPPRIYGSRFDTQ